MYVCKHTMMNSTTYGQKEQCQHISVFPTTAAAYSSCMLWCTADSNTNVRTHTHLFTIMHTQSINPIKSTNKSKPTTIPM